MCICTLLCTNLWTCKYTALWTVYICVLLWLCTAYTLLLCTAYLLCTVVYCYILSTVYTVHCSTAVYYVRYVQRPLIIDCNEHMYDVVDCVRCIFYSVLCTATKCYLNDFFLINFLLQWLKHFFFQTNNSKKLLVGVMLRAV